MHYDYVKEDFLYLWFLRSSSSVLWHLSTLNKYRGLWTNKAHWNLCEGKPIWSKNVEVQKNFFLSKRENIEKAESVFWKLR